MLARIAAEDDTLYVSDQAKRNADLNGSETVTPADLTQLLRILAGLKPIS